MRSRGDDDLPASGIFHGLRRVVDEIHNHTAKQSAVGAHSRKILGKSCFESDAIEASRKYLQRLVDNGVRVRGRQLRGREAHELGEFIHKRGERGYFPFDEPRAFMNQICQLRISRSGSLEDLAAVEE